MADTDFAHTYVNSSGHRLHLAEAGSGPLVVLVHGFPESWYSWRHQLGPLAEAGYRAVAVDVRGYGRSASPAEIEAYAMTALVGDVIAVIDDHDRRRGDGRAEPAVVVGHDWGAPIAWNTALLRPERVRGVAGLSVPYAPRGDTKPLDRMRELAGDDLFYIDYFQQPGVAEAEAEADLETWLRGFYFTASGEGDPTKPSMGLIPVGHEMRERLQMPGPGQMKWLSDEEFAYYLGEFQRTGVTGGLNRYRNITRDWTELAAWRHAPITVPALFIGGERDGPTQLGRAAIERFAQTLPALVHSEILPGCGHWTQQERPDDVNRILLDFLAGL
ncbi:MAG: alpha/beta hydrolase [Acidimicrobiia bacterium]|nr:alpha/beta hydrolase [Acidimicrobiia bacterium]